MQPWPQQAPCSVCEKLEEKAECDADFRLWGGKKQQLNCAQMLINESLNEPPLSDVRGSLYILRSCVFASTLAEVALSRRLVALLRCCTGAGRRQRHGTECVHSAYLKPTQNQRLHAQLCTLLVSSDNSLASKV